MKLIAVTNDQMTTAQLLETLLTIEADIDAVILREKSKTDAEMVDLIQKLGESGFDQSKIIIHGRADMAVLTGILQVQLPGHSLPLAQVKKHFPNIAFGRSVHSFKEAEAAYQAGADWLLYGHVFTTASKEGLPPRGTTELIQIATQLPVPVYAIGGIRSEHLPSLQRAGISGVAFMSAIFNSHEPVTAIAAYKEASHVTPC
ncbi:thiamine phosphate synthase [Sporosarcina sp. FSL K6-1522]|uniref:thiamine phosphate synthase n=1 Tax=Sporosarcina sp. FSL K6-1522 TaxID=2921554 RepID=UPI003159DDE7